MRRLVVIAALALAAAPTASARLPLHACRLGGATGLCAKLAVPENRAQSAGRKISLRVMVLEATFEKPKPDAVFYLAGGPGEAATDAAGAMRVAFARINEDHDIVLVDQRGTGGSNRLGCPAPTAADAEDPAGYVASCRARLAGADLAQYGSSAAADDVDAVRAALGYRKIDLFGGSYGATLAQVYLNRHPATVRTVVLDAGSLLDVPMFQIWGSNGQRALDDIARRCAADARCRAAFPTWAADLPALLARLKASPATVDVAGTPVTLDAVGAEGTIQLLTKSTESAGDVPFVVSRAVAGDLQPLARAALATPGGGGENLLMSQAIMCSEPWARLDPAATAVDARGTYLAEFMADWVARNAVTCPYFPQLPVTASGTTRPHSNVPLLAVLGGADPQDPIGNIAGIRETMPKARLVVVPGQGHGVGMRGCMPNLLAAFIERGSASGLDVSCARRVPLPSFRLS